MPDTLEADQKPWEIYAQKKPWELDWTAPPSDAVPSQEEQAQIRRLPRPEELTTYGGPPKPVASLAETLVEPSEEALSPRITTPKLPIKEGENKLLTIGKEAVNILSGIPEFLSSPAGVVSAVVAPGAPVAVGTVFTATMLKDLADQIQSSYKDWDKMSGTQKTKAITDMVGTGTFAAMPWLKPAISALRGKTTTPEVTDASKVQETTAVHGDVRPQPVESVREVPVEESSSGVQPQAPQGQVPLTVTQTTAPNWNLIAENLRGDLDAWSPARTTGRVNYDLMDVADRFIEYAKSQPATAKLSDLVKDFAKSDEASASQITKLRKSLKNLESQPPQQPTVTETTPPVPQEVPKVPSKTGLYPAVREVGGKVDVGEPGETHPDIIKENKLKAEDIDQRGFVDKEGKFLDREQAAAATQVPTEREAQRLHSTDLPEAQPAVAPVAKAQEEVSKVAATEGQRPAKEVKSELLDKIQKAIDEAPKLTDEQRQFLEPPKFQEKMGVGHAAEIVKRQVEQGKKLGLTRTTIDIPGDGSFTVWNTKEALSGLLDRAKRISTSPEPVKIKRSGISKDDKAWVEQQILAQVEASKARAKEQLSGPGTPAAAQPPDPKAAIEALEESFRNIKGPKPTLEDQVRKAFSVGEKAARAKDTVSSAIQGLKSSGDYLINKWKGEPKIDNMLRAKGELSAELETRGWRVRQFVKTVNKAMPTQRQRAAVLKWVDAGGDPAELQRGLAETKPEFKQAYSDALALKGDDLIAAQNIRSYFEERLQDAMDAGVLQHGVEDYIHRLYERDPKTQKQALAYVQSGLLQQNPALVKKRVFQFDWEAEKTGRRPIQDFLPRIANYESSLSRAIAAREFVRKMVGFEQESKRVPGMKAPDGRPVVDVAGLGVPVEDAAGVREATLIKPSFKPGDETDPKNNRRDYVERDYPALRKWRWTTLDAGGKPIYVQGNLLIHPDFAGRIDALLEPSRVKYGRYPTLGKAALGVSSTVKQTMLDLSGFHQVQITVHGMEHKVMPWKIVSDIDFQNPNMDGLLKGGLTLGGEYYSAHHGEGLVGSALTRHIPILGPLMESYHNWLFQSYIPRIKTTMALAALERNRARYKGQLTEEQIYTKTANEANSAFGELNYIMLERSKTTQDIARLVMLAPDFLEARGRFAGGALEKGGKLVGHEQRAALLLGALTMYVTARIMNKLTDDKYHFEPENAFSLVHDGHAYSLRTVQGDILHLLEKPLQFWMNRLNPVFGRTALEIATGRDTFGRKRTVPEALWDTVKNTMPIALRSSQERKLWESMMNSMGVTARRWNDVDKAFTLAKDWKAKHGVTEPGEFIYDAEKDPLRGLKIALSRNDDAGAAQEIKKVLASKVYTREKLNAYFDRYAKMPFTGSASNDKKWMATLTDDQKKIVEGARQHKLALRNMYRQSRAKFDDLMRTPLQ